MQKRSLIPIVAIVALTVGCATSSNSILLGVGIGAGVGGGMGVGMGSSDHNEVRIGVAGAVVGAAIGGLSGYLYHKEQEERKRAQAQLSPGNDGQGTPSMTMPRVRRVWVPDKIEGNQLIRGHFVYEIESSSTWRMDDEKRSQ
jgi:hypothetical protein